MTITKTVKRILWGVGILVTIVVIFLITYFFLANSMMKKMKPLETGKITGEVYAIRDGIVNMYLVRCDKEYIAIDAGIHPETIRKELTALGIGPNQVASVFLTHSDADHAGSVPLFANAAVYLTNQEEKLINGEKSRFLIFGNSLKCKNIRLLGENQVTIVSGTHIRCILTPGHTPGSASYLIDDTYLFTGDGLSLKDGKVREFYRLPNMDTKTQRTSIKKLSLLKNTDYLFTAHDGMTNEVNAAFSNW